MTCCWRRARSAASAVGHREGLVVGVGVERLRAAEHGREGLDGDAGQVVERLLRRERDAGGLGVEAHPGRALVLGVVALRHELVPDPARGPELRDLLEEVAVAVEEEAQARREVVDAQPAPDRRLDVGHPVGDGERQLLDRGRAGLADVVARDRDGVPAGHLVGPELDRVGHQAHRRLGREQELLLGDELLQDVVLGRALECRPRIAGLLGRDDVHRPDRRGRRVDRHRGRDAVQRQAVEQDLHVGQRADADAARPELALGFLVVGVVAVERRHVVGDRQAGLAGGEQVLEAGVGVLGGAEAREHPHRPEARSVPRRMDAAGVRRLPGQADARVRVLRRRTVPGAVDRVELDLAERPEARLASRCPGQRRVQALDLPTPPALLPALPLVRAGAAGARVRGVAHGRDGSTGFLRLPCAVRGKVGLALRLVNRVTRAPPGPHVPPRRPRQPRRSRCGWRDP